MLLLNNGNIYTWGNNSLGELGLGDKENRVIPTLVSTLQNVRILKISCGSSHSFAISDSGIVYSWGKNNQGQCGIGNTIDQV